MPTKSRQAKCPIEDPNDATKYKDIDCTPDLLCPGHTNVISLGSAANVSEPNFE